MTTFEVFNTFVEDTMNVQDGVGLPPNVFNVFGGGADENTNLYHTIQDAIDTAVALQFDGDDPAIIAIRPNQTSGTSGVYTEDLTLYDGIYLMSATPQQQISITGNVTFSDAAGQYLLQDLSFTESSGSVFNDGAGTLAAGSLVNFVRVDATNSSSLASGADTVGDFAGAAGTINIYDSTWRCTGSPGNDGLATLHVDGGGAATTVTVNVYGQSLISGYNVDSAPTNDRELAINVDYGATVNVYDTDVYGFCTVGANAVSTLNLYRCSVNVELNTLSYTGLIHSLANNASIVNTEFCKFNNGATTGLVNVFDSVGTSNIFRGQNCSWVTTAVALASVTPVAAGVGGTSYWDGGPVVPATLPANAITGTQYVDALEIHRVA